MARGWAFGCVRLGGWPAGVGGRRISVFVAVVAVASVVPVSLLVSMARRVATRTVDCCLEHERQTSEFALALLASNGCWVRRTGGVDHGSHARPLCGNGCVQAGREGLRPYRRPGSPQNRGDGADVGLDNERNLGVAGTSDQRTGEFGGDGGDR